MHKIHPSLCFSNNIKQAVDFYISVFKNSSIKKIAYYGEDAAKATGQKSGDILSIEFEIENQVFLAIGGTDFKFSPALSFSVYCEDEKEINSLWEKLSKNGPVLMELQKYPWAEKYGWCTDAYGLSWQLIIGKSEQKITPSFLFVNELFGKGEEAIKFYTSLFKNSKIKNIHRDQNSNTVMHATFILDGESFVLMEGAGKEHKHTMTPATSFIINCEDQKEIDYFWDKFSEKGTPNVCSWIQDQYGISWQVVPSTLGAMVADPDQRKSQNVMNAVMSMSKLNVETLISAYQK